MIKFLKINAYTLQFDGYVNIRWPIWSQEMCHGQHLHEALIQDTLFICYN